MNQIPRIAIVGTSSTGKTLLCEELVKFIPISLIKEGARFLYEERQRRPGWDRSNPALQLELQHEIYASKIKQELEAFNTGFVSDRSYLDIYMYFLYNCGSIVTEQQCLLFEHINQAAMNIYTHIFTLNLGSIDYRTDVIRYESFGTALLYETSLNGLFQRWHISPISISANRLADRVSFILEIIGYV